MNGLTGAAEVVWEGKESDEDATLVKGAEHCNREKGVFNAPGL